MDHSSKELHKRDLWSINYGAQILPIGIFRDQISIIVAGVKMITKSSKMTIPH